METYFNVSVVLNGGLSSYDGDSFNEKGAHDLLNQFKRKIDNLNDIDQKRIISIEAFIDKVTIDDDEVVEMELVYYEKFK